MLRLLLLSLSCLLCRTPLPEAGSSPLDSLEGMPKHDTPKKLTEAWLHFHEEGLCQGLDAVFELNAGGMVVRGLIEDDKSYEKLEALLQPLRGSYKIELRLDRRREEKKPGEKNEKDPPASLWENYELRSFLGDPAARARERMDLEEDPYFDLPPPGDMLKARLLIYAEQVLEWSRKMERYSEHLPALARVAHDPAFSPGLRSRASEAVTAHARDLEKFRSKLNASLERAFPHSDKRDRIPRTEKAGPAPNDIVDYADQVSEFARTVSQRIVQFIHPEQHTVGLDELRQPGLLESLKVLRQLNLDFQKAFAKTK
jgi:hypothetical protein